MNQDKLLWILKVVKINLSLREINDNTIKMLSDISLDSFSIIINELSQEDFNLIASNVGSRHPDMIKLFPEKMNMFRLSREFYDWNNRLSRDYSEKYTEFSSRNSGVESFTAESMYPLFRSTSQKPEDVFKENGSLLPSSYLHVNKDDEEEVEYAKQAQRRFSTISHKMDYNAETGRSESGYTATTRDIMEAAGIAGFGNNDSSDDEGSINDNGDDSELEERRSWVYIIDPQPNGRDLNALNLSKNENNLLAREIGINSTSFLEQPVEKKMMFREQEVAVPGPIPASDIRGAVPVSKDGRSIDYSRLVKNDWYLPLAAYPALYT